MSGLRGVWLQVDEDVYFDLLIEAGQRRMAIGMVLQERLLDQGYDFFKRPEPPKPEIDDLDGPLPEGYEIDEETL